MTDTNFFDGLYNSSGFDGTVQSDFLRLGLLAAPEKRSLIDYSVITFDEHREAFDNYIKAVYPTDYSNFYNSDLGGMLMDLIAYMGSVISLRTDMIANEMYLPTVKNKTNLTKLLQLIGVSMKGPTSAKATGLVSLTDADKLTDAAHAIVIPFSQRSVAAQNSRDTTPVTYTMYKMSTDGSLNTESTQLEDLELTYSESDDTGGREWSNVILLEGSLGQQTGTFSTASTLQSIEIANPSIIEGSIFVVLDDGSVYSEIKNLFLASDGTHEVFEKVYNSNYSCTLNFGDNIRGKSPTPGSGYTVYYRSGGGSRGNILENTINLSFDVTKTDSSSPVATLVASVVNSTHGSGGFEAETIEHAKRYAPYFFKTQYRAVTGEDYTTLASTFVGTAGSTAKANAVLRQAGSSANMIDIYVLGKATALQLERASIAFKKELLDHLNEYKMLTDEVTIVDGVVRTVDLVCSLYVDAHREKTEEEIKQKVADKLLSYFNVDNRDFAQSLEIADLVGDVLSVPEVRFFRINNFDDDIRVGHNEIIQLNNFELNVEFV